LIARISVTLAVFASSPARAYDADVQMQQSIAIVGAIVQLVRAQIASLGAPDVRAADAQISFVVDDTPIPNAFEQNGVIHISNSLHVMFLYVADAGVENAAHQTFGACGDAYGTYLTTVVSQNKVRVVKGLPLQAVKPPEEFIALSQPLCAGFEKAFPVSAELRKWRDQRVIDMIGFVYLHELAHFALHHTGVTDAAIHAALGGIQTPQALSELARSRDQEFAADAWALRQYIRMFGPEPNLMYYDLQKTMTIMGNSFDCTHDVNSTHPTGIERYAALTSVYRDEFKRKIGYDVSPQESDLLNDWVKFSKHARDGLHCESAAPVPAMTDPHDYGNCYAEHRCFASPAPFKPLAGTKGPGK